MGFSVKFDKLSQDGPFSILMGHKLFFSKYVAFVSMKIDFANSVDPDEISH